jgi:hypothetical protein
MMVMEISRMKLSEKIPWRKMSSSSEVWGPETTTESRLFVEGHNRGRTGHRDSKDPDVWSVDD